MRRSVAGLPDLDGIVKFKKITKSDTEGCFSVDKMFTLYS